jgi:hypothetical protein
LLRATVIASAGEGINCLVDFRIAPSVWSNSPGCEFPRVKQRSMQEFKYHIPPKTNRNKINEKKNIA